MKKIAYLYLDMTELKVTVPSPPTQPPDDFISIIEKLVSELNKRGYTDVESSYNNVEGICIKGKRALTEEERELVQVKLKEYQFPDAVSEIVLADSIS